MAKTKAEQTGAVTPAWAGDLVVGQSYYFQGTRGLDYVGRLVAVAGPHDVVLEDAAMVCNTGRPHVFFSAGRAEGMEIEPVGPWRMTWAGARPWPFPLFPEAV